jgi:hypothetical protein
MSYETNCIVAAHNQGIDEIAHYLKAKGLDPSIEQTGGYVMVCYLHDPGARSLGITAEAVCWTGDEVDEETVWVSGDRPDALKAAKAGYRAWTNPHQWVREDVDGEDEKFWTNVGRGLIT